MRRFSAGLLMIFVFGAFVAPTGAQRPSPAPAPARLELTVDSIMRGPELVGWPSTQLRWSPDSRHLYFSWRKPGDKAEALYVVARDGGAPRKLSNEEAGKSTIALVRSYSNKPPEVYLMPNQPGADARQVTTTPTEEWRAFNWIDPRVITYKARDGVDL